VPTPKAFDLNKNVKKNKNGQEFDDLYDLTDNEVEEVAVRISASLDTPTEEMKRPRRHYPSLVIPSPNQWPSVQKLQKTAASPSPLLSPGLLSPNAYMSPTPEALAKLVARTTHRSSSNAPSLDESFTSDELSHQSCPPTPDLASRMENPEDWSAPVQLHPDALETLECLTGVTQESDSVVFAIPVAEMQEIGMSGEADRVDIIITPVDTDDGTLSFLSIPSPGGFFSALEPSSRHTWLPSPSDAPSTSIAERFYNIPWHDRISEDSLGRRSNQGSPPALTSPPIVGKTVVVPEDDENLTEGPPTAVRIPLTSPKASANANQNGSQTEVPSTQGSRTVSMGSIHSFPTAVGGQQSEYKETYDAELKANSKVNLDRTTLWLDQQTNFIEEELTEEKPQSPRERANSDPASIISASDDGSNGQTSHKSVRFADNIQIQSPSSQESSPESPKDSTFVRGFKHLSMNTQKTDAFVHRRTRNEALRLDRRCLFSSHVNQLEGKYDIVSPDRVAPMRPISHFGIGEQEEDSAEKEIIANAQKERRALEQIKPVSWNLEATKMLNGGTLLMSPTGKSFPKIRKGRVLDLGGQATCDWAWQVALEHPTATVHTVFTGQQQVDTSIEGPENHKQTSVPNLWTLPFPNNHFHLISARNLYAHLKTFKPKGLRADEYDLTLKECMRVLKPGGYLEFALLDADILASGPMASALSVEFCFNLKTRGYDPSPTKGWLPRLRKAGFGQVRRAWLILPMAQQTDAEKEARAEMFANETGTTADASLISGMVGSWAWERWMLRLHREMGRDEERLLEGVQAALEEGAKTGASWRYLSGWARKPLRIG
jgi:SAM-dependent methyltransferase